MRISARALGAGSPGLDALGDARRACSGDLGRRQLVACAQGLVHQVPGGPGRVAWDVLQPQDVRQLVRQDLPRAGVPEGTDDARGRCLDGLAAEIVALEVADEENRYARMRRESPDEIDESVAVDAVAAARDLLRRGVEGLDVKLDVRLAKHVVGVQEGFVEAGAVLPGRHLAACRDSLAVDLRPRADAYRLLDDLVFADGDRDGMDLERDADRHDTGSFPAK